MRPCSRRSFVRGGALALFALGSAPRFLLRSALAQERTGTPRILSANHRARSCRRRAGSRSPTAPIASRRRAAIRLIASATVTLRLKLSVKPCIGTAIDPSHAAIAVVDRPSCSLPRRSSSGITTSSRKSWNCFSGAAISTGINVAVSPGASRSTMNIDSCASPLVVSVPVFGFAAWMFGETMDAMPGWVPVLSLLWQTVWIASLTFMIWFWLIITYSASRLSAFTFLTPLFGVAAGHFVMGDPITPAFAGAAALVIAGLILVNRPK